jgi:hypothetical protein
MFLPVWATLLHTHVRCGRKALIEHHVGVFRACPARLQDIDCTKLPAFACFIVQKDAFAAHCGLGSTSGAALGVLHGLNECFARPFTRDQIHRILACNYVEECRTSPGYLVYGYKTTMTATGAHGGGCYVVDEDSLDILARNCIGKSGDCHVIGKPFAGKTAVCGALADVIKEKHVVHFAAGEYLRRFIASNLDADDAETIADIMKRGEVMDTEHVTANVLIEELFANISLYMDNSDIVLHG